MSIAPSDRTAEPTLARRHLGTRPQISAHDGTPPFAVDIEAAPGGIRLTVTGEIDMSTAPALQDALGRAVADHSVVHLELGGVSFIDSSGLHTLMAARSAAEGRAVLAVVGAAPCVIRLLEMTGMTELLAHETPSPTDAPDSNVIRELANLVPGCASASVVHVRRGVPTTSVAADHVARAADAAQFACDSGPSLTALRRGEAVVLPRIVAGPGRYEEFRSAAVPLGVSNMVAVPVRTAEGTTVAVNLYSTRADAIDVQVALGALHEWTAALGWALVGADLS
jgi:anti-anti-sigma factor